MNPSLPQIILFLLLGMALIILFTARWRVNAFFALLIAAFVVGFGVGMPAAMIMNSIKDGFGNIMRSLGLLIVLGTTLGVLLEQSGCSRVMANTILRITGERRAQLAMSITGFLVGLPVFCDSGFIVLSGLNTSLVRRTGISMVIMAVSLATGLYAVHCLLPPHPGAAAGAAVLGVDMGILLSTGIAVALPAVIVGNLWARFAGKKLTPVILPEEEAGGIIHPEPPVFMAFLPVLVPIFLIAFNSFLSIRGSNSYLQPVLSVLGEPVVALAVGIGIIFVAVRHWTLSSITQQLQAGVEKAGSILVITGAGGAFGAVLSATQLGTSLSAVANLSGMGILFPFLISFVLKTAQGSSTVAMITAASIVLPLLPVLGLDTSHGKLLCLLSMGAGSMMISHANDSYFWVVAKFSGLDMRSMLRVYSLATLWMGLVSLAVVYLLSYVLL
ncbi:MAG: GntP family permease [Terrimonas sp.]|nr:GntP family permease [Terrimonas sp.]